MVQSVWTIYRRMSIFYQFELCNIMVIQSATAEQRDDLNNNFMFSSSFVNAQSGILEFSNQNLPTHARNHMDHQRANKHSMVRNQYRKNACTGGFQASGFKLLIPSCQFSRRPEFCWVLRGTACNCVKQHGTKECYTCGNIWPQAVVIRKNAYLSRLFLCHLLSLSFPNPICQRLPVVEHDTNVMLFGSISLIFTLIKNL